MCCMQNNCTINYEAYIVLSFIKEKKFNNKGMIYIKDKNQKTLSVFGKRNAIFQINLKLYYSSLTRKNFDNFFKNYL